MSPGENHIPARSRFGRPSDSPIISVKLKYGRLYFSAFAVKALNLEAARFKIFRRGKRWLLKKTSGSFDLIVTIHQKAYYVVSKKLALEMAAYFQSERLSFLIEGTDRKRKYYSLQYFVPTPSAKEQLPLETPVPTRSKKDPKLASAERILERFYSTNFEGRVKTAEIIKAEQILNGN